MYWKFKWKTQDFTGTQDAHFHELTTAQKDLMPEKVNISERSNRFCYSLY